MALLPAKRAKKRQLRAKRAEMPEFGGGKVGELDVPADLRRMSDAFDRDIESRVAQR